MPASSEYSIAIAKQSAKGSAAAANTGFKMGIIGGDFDAARTFQQLAETDASIQQGSTQAILGTIGGTPEFYLRPRTFPMFAYGVLGANADSGAGPYVHTITPTTATPYWTVWVNRGSGTQITKFTDCRMVALAINMSNGGFLTFSCQMMGLGALFGTTDASTTLESEPVFVYPEVTIARGGGAAAGIIQNLTLNVSRNGAVIPGDNTWTGFDVGLGRLTVDGTFSALWQTDVDYRLWQTGTSGGTAFGATVASETLTITATKSASAIVQAVMAGVTVTQLGQPVGAGGEPVVASYTYAAQRQAAIASHLSFLCTNSLATVPGA